MAMGGTSDPVDSHLPKLRRKRAAKKIDSRFETVEPYRLAHTMSRCYHI